MTENYLRSGNRFKRRRDMVLLLATVEKEAAKIKCIYEFEKKQEETLQYYYHNVMYEWRVCDMRTCIIIIITAVVYFSAQFFTVDSLYTRYNGRPRRVLRIFRTRFLLRKYMKKKKTIMTTPTVITRLRAHAERKDCGDDAWGHHTQDRSHI